MTALFLIRHAANNFTQEEKLAGWLQGFTSTTKDTSRPDRWPRRWTRSSWMRSTPARWSVQSRRRNILQNRAVWRFSRAKAGRDSDGQWEGQKMDDLNKSDEWRMFQFYPSGARPPGGETGRQVQMRAVDEVEAICAAHPEGSIAIVSHSDTLKAIVAHYAGIHLDLFQRLVISPASVSVIWIGPHGRAWCASTMLDR